MNINTELIRIVWDPNKRTPSLWSGLVVIHGLGSPGGGTFLLFWSKATVILSHSVSNTKIGLGLYTNVDCLDSGDFGNRVNFGVVMVHFEICSKLIRPWNLSWKVWLGHSTKDSVGFWKNRKLNDPKLYRTLGAAIFKEQWRVWLDRRDTWHVGKWLIRLWHRKLLLEPRRSQAQSIHAMTSWATGDASGG